MKVWQVATHKRRNLTRAEFPLYPCFLVETLALPSYFVAFPLSLASRILCAMKRFGFLLLLLLILGACASWPYSPASPDLPPGFGLVTDSWEAVFEAGEVVVDRRIEISPELATLLRGAPSLNPDALDASLLQTGASEAKCHLFDTRTGFSKIAISCRYHYPLLPTSGLGAQSLPLPDGTLLSFLAELPIESAQGIHIQTTGQVTFAGIVTELPSSQTLEFQNGGYSLHRYSLASLSKLTVTGEIRLPPGVSSSTFDLPLATVEYLPRYLPRPSAWLALGAALVAALAAIGFVFPASARFSAVAYPWEPDLSRMPFLLRWLASLTVRFVNWLYQSWPPLLRYVLGWGLTGFGIHLLVSAWSLASIYNDPEALRQLLYRLSADFPLAGLFGTFVWPGWPVVVGLIGVGLIIAGAGLLARHEAARLATAGLGVAAIAGVILLWPHLLLAPPFIPFQLELALVLGAGLLIALAVFARALTHPRFRRYYANIQ